VAKSCKTNRYVWFVVIGLGGESVGLNIHPIQEAPRAMAPFSPPLCVEAADKIYGLGTSRMEAINIAHYAWEQDLLL